MQLSNPKAMEYSLGKTESAKKMHFQISFSNLITVVSGGPV